MRQVGSEERGGAAPGAMAAGLRPSRARGVTLPEILVAGTLLLLVSGTSYATLVLANRSTVASACRAAAAVNTEVALERLRRELRESSPESVTFLSGGPALSFRTARDVQGRFLTRPDGTPDWQGFLIYYLDQGSLRRHRLADTARTVLDGQALDQECDGSGRIVAYGVQGLTVSMEDRQATVGVTCQTETSGKINRLRLEAGFAVRN